MNNQVEMLVERYNANREALAHTQAAQAHTQRQVGRAQVELRNARRQLDQRVWAIYTTGASAVVAPLAELVNAGDLHQLLTVAKYQQDVLASDRRMLTRVGQAKHALEVLAARLAAQRQSQEGLQEQLAAQHRQIERQLAGQRAYLARVTAQVRKAVEEERRRQEQLRRQAIARRLAVAFALAQLGKPYQWGATGPAPSTTSACTSGAG
jgi:peptidoglycan DL-endopeptidase CwlO